MAHLDVAVDSEPPVRVLKPRAPAARPGIGGRLISFVALSGVLSGFGYAGASAYHVLTDSFVAPIILSPDNDLVIQSKLSLGRVVTERQMVAGRLAQNRAAVESARSAIGRLEELRTEASRALDWSRAITDQQAAAGAGTLARLAEQRREVERMTSKQERYVAEMHENLDAGLIRKSDLVREENALSELHVAALQNDRDRLAAALQEHAASLAQRSLRGGHASRRLATPEMLAQREQLVHIELDLMKVEADLRDKQAQLTADQDELGKADELIAQMKARPIFRAIEASQNVAFVPYTQMNGVRAGADVYACDVWGVFLCRRVGRVSELLPGEVATQDPWGTPARGQYALLGLTDPTAAQSKTLRVRTAADAPAPRDEPRAPGGSDSTGGPLSQR